MQKILCIIVCDCQWPTLDTLIDKDSKYLRGFDGSLVAHINDKLA